MNVSDIMNGGAMCRSAMCGAVAVTAAGSGDATEVDGQWIEKGDAKSAKLVVAYKAVMAGGRTLAIAANIQDASDSSGTGAADYGTVYSSHVVATQDSPATTLYGTAEFDYDLNGAKDYVRAQFTPDLNAVGVDTAIISATLIFFGEDGQPVSATLV